MIFRFKYNPEIEMVKLTSNKLQGLKYKNRRPSSVELTKCELIELLENKEKMAEVVLRMEEM